MDEEELFATALEVRILASLLVRIAARSLEQRLEAQGAPLSTLQHGVMRLLCRQHYTSSELSRKMHLDPATMVPVVDTLERQGLIERGKDPHDRRRCPLALTESGTELMARLPLFDRADALASGLNDLGAHEARELLHLLRELLEHMAPNDALANELAAIAQTARDMFRAQTAPRPTPPIDNPIETDSSNLET